MVIARQSTLCRATGSKDPRRFRQEAGCELTGLVEVHVLYKDRVHALTVWSRLVLSLPFEWQGHRRPDSVPPGFLAFSDPCASPGSLPARAAVVVAVQEGGEKRSGEESESRRGGFVAKFCQGNLPWRL